jgi:hypothetical protein
MGRKSTDSRTTATRGWLVSSRRRSSAGSLRQVCSRRSTSAKNQPGFTNVSGSQACPGILLFDCHPGARSKCACILGRISTSSIRKLSDPKLFRIVAVDRRRHDALPARTHICQEKCKRLQSFAVSPRSMAGDICLGRSTRSTRNENSFTGSISFIR